MKIIKVESCWGCPRNCTNIGLKGLRCKAYYRKAIKDPAIIPDWCPLENTPDAAELWAVAQLMPGEGIEDGVMRVEESLGIKGKASPE